MKPINIRETLEVRIQREAVREMREVEREVYENKSGERVDIITTHTYTPRYVHNPHSAAALCV